MHCGIFRFNIIQKICCPLKSFLFMKKLLLLIGVCLGLIASHESLSQATNASFAGLITDNKSEPLPGTTVQVRNESTGFLTGTQTQPDGKFYLKQLPLGGPYTITVTSVGFAATKKSGYSLYQGCTITINFELQEEATQLQEIEITGTSFAENTNGSGAVTQVSATQ